MRRLFPAPGDVADVEVEVRKASSARPPGGPWVSFNFISSLDGAATAGGLSGALGNAWDQRVFTLLRSTADVVLVGGQTVRAEGYGGPLLSPNAQAWRVGKGLSPHPPLAIVSGSLNLSPEHPAFADAPTRPLVLTLEAAPRERREALAEVAEVVNVGRNELDVGRLINGLTERGYSTIHAEGGPRLFGTFVEADRVDELSLTIAPLLVGGDAGRISHSAQAALRTMELDRLLQVESMLFLRYVRARNSAG